MSATAPAPILLLFLGAIWGTADRIPSSGRCSRWTEVFGPLDLVTERGSRTLRGVCHIVEHEDNEMMRPYAIGPIPSPIP